MRGFQARRLRCGDHTIELGDKTLIMGILNVTPDSFSDGGKFTDPDAAVEQAKRMIDEGADLIDVGGESTRPGFSMVSAEEELQRVIPVLQALRPAIDVPISVDTYKAEVAERALQAGAGLINDIWGLKEDPRMAGVAARYECPVILMHNRRNPSYTNLLDDVRRDLLESVGIARAHGIPDDRLILDPGIGFAKNYEHNLELMSKLDQLADLGFPLLLGTSRKSMIRTALGLPAHDVVEGTVATTVLGIAQGCDIVRVHDVKANKRAAVMADAILRRSPAARQGRSSPTDG